MSYKEMTKEELQEIRKEVAAKYDELKAKGLKLDMSRGKPNTEQLDISMGMIDTLTDYNLVGEQGVDCRNYGVLDGIIEAKRLLSAMIECPVDNIIIYGNSSLNVMYDTVARSMTHGVMGSTPWAKLDKVKFLCPVPGYDRHFAITEFFGIEMINIPMNDEGPDLDLINELIQDDSVKGMFCVPKYSNPQGITYSGNTVKALAALKPAASDFRIIYDNAYCVHDLYDNGDILLNIFDELPKYNNEDLIIMVASTSKITFAGGGVSCIVASDNNINDIKKRLSVQSISQDKMNQLRHFKFFNDVNGIKQHMKKHATILKPKFDCVIDILNNELKGKDIASWHNPKGGYFISLDVMPGCAKRVGTL